MLYKSASVSEEVEGFELVLDGLRISHLKWLDEDIEVVRIKEKFVSADGLKVDLEAATTTFQKEWILLAYATVLRRNFALDTRFLEETMASQVAVHLVELIIAAEDGPSLFSFSHLDGVHHDVARFSKHLSLLLRRLYLDAILAISHVIACEVANSVRKAVSRIRSIASLALGLIVNRCQSVLLSRRLVLFAWRFVFRFRIRCRR